VKRAALILGGAALAALSLEVGVRLMLAFDRNFIAAIDSRPSPEPGAELELADLIQRHPDERVAYELRPNVRGRYLGVDVRTNSHGMRGRERSLDKPPGVFRIVGLGDSHAFGWGVAESETFYERLEALLTERLAPRRFEVWNLGVPGYNTVQEVRAFLLRADRLDPDLVVVNYVHNDMDLPNFLADAPDLFATDVSYLRQLVHRRWRALRGRPLRPFLVFGVEQDPRTGRFLFDERVPERYRKLVGWDRMERAFLRLARYAGERRIPAAVLVNVDDYRARLAGKTGDARPRDVRSLCDRLARSGLLIIDPQDRIAAYLREHQLPASAVWLSASDSHTNTLRHGLVAEELFEALSTAGLLREARSSPLRRAGEARGGES
jgi:hypothetical protein